MYSETSRVQGSRSSRPRAPGGANIAAKFRRVCGFVSRSKMHFFVVKLQYCVMELWKRVKWSTLHHEKQDCIEWMWTCVQFFLQTNLVFRLGSRPVIGAKKILFFHEGCGSHERQRIRRRTDGSAEAATSAIMYNFGTSNQSGKNSEQLRVFNARILKSENIYVRKSCGVSMTIKIFGQSGFNILAKQSPRTRSTFH